MKEIKRKNLSGVIAGALGTGVALSMIATGAVAQQAQRVEKIEVTGSSIKRVDAEGPQPVITIERIDIELSGKTTLTELLVSLPISAGSFTESVNAGNSFAPGTAGISLRGLGTNTTLVLLNGRRIAGYGFAQNISEAFVDLNSIPITAIERIEILKDGASAIYGSDAIAGVINVILRKDFTGAEISAMVGDTQDGGGAEWRVNGSLGWGNLAKDRYNVMATVDYFKREELQAAQRSFSRTANQDPRGGYDQRSPTGNPGTWLNGGNYIPWSNCPPERNTDAILGVPTCAYDFAGDNWLLPKTERLGIFARGQFDIASNLSLFGEAGYSKNITNSSAAPTPGSFLVSAANPSNPFGVPVTAIYRTLDIGKRLEEIESENLRVLGGLKGTAGVWDWESAIGYSKNEVSSSRQNYVITSDLRAAIAGTLPGFIGTYYNLTDNSRNSPALLEALRYSPLRVGESEMKFFDAKASRELGQLAGGAAAIAVGGDFRQEELSDTPDPRSLAGQVSGSGGTLSKGDRDSYSAYAELSLPFVKNLETQLAVRYDHYSDFGSTTNPKIGMSYRPVKDLMFRGGWGKGFRAPSLVELYLGETTSFTNTQDAPRCNAYTAAFGASDSRTRGVCGAPQVRQISGGNRELEAEKSENIYAGFVVEPASNLTLSVDYFNIRHTNRVTSPTGSFVVANASQFPSDWVRRVAPNATDILAGAPGGLLGTATTDPNVPGIYRLYFNSTEQRVWGYDVEMRYRWNVANWGRFTAGAYVTYLGTFKQQINPGADLTELVDSYEYPRMRGLASLRWDTGPWTTTLVANWRSSFDQYYQVQTERVASYTTMDLSVQYTGIKNLTLTVGGTNIFNEDPPFADQQWTGYSDSIDSPRGAFWYGKVAYSFK